MAHDEYDHLRESADAAAEPLKLVIQPDGRVAAEPVEPTFVFSQTEGRKYVVAFLEWVRHQNTINEWEDGEAPVFIPNGQPNEPSDFDIGGLADAFIELEPRFWSYDTGIEKPNE